MWKPSSPDCGDRFKRSRLYAKVRHFKGLRFAPPEFHDGGHKVRTSRYSWLPWIQYKLTRPERALCDREVPGLNLTP